jgi:hypothetical protein
LRQDIGFQSLIVSILTNSGGPNKGKEAGDGGQTAQRDE